MAKKSELRPGVRVRIKGLPERDHTGTVLRRSRVAFMRLYAIELDQPGFKGRGVTHVGRRGLEILPPE